MTLGSAFQIAMVPALGKTVGALGGTLLTDRIGRKPCIVAFSTVGAAIGAGLAYTHGAAFLVTAFVLAVCLGLANTIAFTVYVPELFEKRGSACAAPGCAGPLADCPRPACST